ncbi:unnamed protein product [Durusdinium trenchii]|uniref:Uncharacterized protein n=1 Tax=Durusdinium trenchii TaxID=1381693 RepID=A0ABP0LXD9_9DINO
MVADQRSVRTAGGASTQVGHAVERMDQAWPEVIPCQRGVVWRIQWLTAGFPQRSLQLMFSRSETTWFELNDRCCDSDLDTNSCTECLRRQQKRGHAQSYHFSFESTPGLDASRS